MQVYAIKFVGALTYYHPIRSGNMSLRPGKYFGILPGQDHIII
jgi:hypothetical protein